MDSPSLTVRTTSLPASGFNDPSTPIYNRDVTPLDDMNGFRCWKVAMFVAGAILTVTGAIFAAGGFGVFGIGGLVSTPVGACICAVGANMMAGSGLLMYLDHTTDSLPIMISGPTLAPRPPIDFAALLAEYD
jgi:hypothetical protein